MQDQLDCISREQSQETLIYFQLNLEWVKSLIKMLMPLRIGLKRVNFWIREVQIHTFL